MKYLWLMNIGALIICWGSAGHILKDGIKEKYMGRALPSIIICFLAGCINIPFIIWGVMK